MQLNITTDYAIRVVLYLALRKEMVSGGQISEAMGIPPNYMTKLTRNLREADILRAEQGQRGGYTLNRNPADISLYDIVRAMEGTTRINRCLEEDHYCSRHAVEDCPVRRNYQKLQSIFDTTLNDITIESLM